MMTRRKFVGTNALGFTGASKLVAASQEQPSYNFARILLDPHSRICSDLYTLSNQFIEFHFETSYSFSNDFQKLSLTTKYFVISLSHLPPQVCPTAIGSRGAKNKELHRELLHGCDLAGCTFWIDRPRRRCFPAGTNDSATGGTCGDVGATDGN